jgi:hypothetical protein
LRRQQHQYKEYSYHATTISFAAPEVAPRADRKKMTTTVVIYKRNA